MSQFGGGTGDTFYDIGGTGTTIAPGFRQTSLGNADLKWEENKSTNVGVDLDFLEGRGNFTADLYRRTTDNLLFDPPNPATAGLAAPAIVNIGKMKNSGIDFAFSYRGTLGEATVWSMTFTGSHYKNYIVQIDGSHDFFYGPIATRFGNQIINQVGSPSARSTGWWRTATSGMRPTRMPICQWEAVGPTPLPARMEPPRAASGSKM